MKNLVFSFVLSLLAIFATGQISCTASFVSNQSQSNTAVVQFVNNSSVSQFQPTTYTWNYGDSNVSTLQNNSNVTHTYSAAGTYHVSLQMDVYDSITNLLVCTSYDYDTIVIGSITTVTAHSTALQTASGSLIINFQGSGTKTSSVPSYSTYSWDFGDANGSVLQNPTHTYASIGRYTVALTHEVRDSATSSIIAKASFSRYVNPGSVDSCDATMYTYVYQNTLQVNCHAYGNAASYLGHRYPKNYSWDFGDGNSANNKTVTHTYAQAGTYTIALYMDSYDSINQTVFCRDTAYTTITVAYNPPPSCNASYYVDTASSGGSNIFVYNNSTPSQNNPNYSVSYGWSFGDGDTSVLPYPSHTYASSGAYVVCLSIRVTDTNNLTCIDVFCDTIGIDSLGNVIYKNASTGFTLNVLDPTIGVEEHALAKLTLYPNPASEWVELQGLTQSAQWQVFSIGGEFVGTGKVSAEKPKISLPNVKDGLYILNLIDDTSQKSFKLQIKN